MAIAIIVGLLVGAAALYLGTSLLRREVRELQYGLADLEDRLVREVKKRAAAARWEEPPGPETVKEELQRGFLHPAEFARRKSERRMSRGTEDRQIPGEGG